MKHSLPPPPLVHCVLLPSIARPEPAVVAANRRERASPACSRANLPVVRSESGPARPGQPSDRRPTAARREVQCYGTDTYLHSNSAPSVGRATWLAQPCGRHRRYVAHATPVSEKVGVALSRRVTTRPNSRPHTQQLAGRVEVIGKQGRHVDVREDGETARHLRKLRVRCSKRLGYRNKCPVGMAPATQLN